jgi:hypothetical protein
VDGFDIARADLGIVGTRELREYDGGEHLQRPRQRRDLRRARLISDAGYVRKGYTKEDVLHQGVSILRDADRAISREHAPERTHARGQIARLRPQSSRFVRVSPRATERSSSSSVPPPDLRREGSG